MENSGFQGLKRVRNFLADCCLSCCKKTKEDEPTEKDKLLGGETSKSTDSTASRIFADLASDNESDNDKQIDTSVEKLLSVDSIKEEDEATKQETTAQVEPLLVDLSESSPMGPTQMPEPELQKEGVNDSEHRSSKKSGKKRPNYFVGFQISNEEVLGGLKLVQDAVLKAEPNLKIALEPLAKAHITLGVVHIEDNVKLEKAKEALEICCKDLQSDFQQNPLNIEIAKISHFNGKVLFAEIGESKERVVSLAEKVVSAFEDQQFEMRESRPFHPHLTLFKFKFPSPKKYTGPKKIPAHCYQEYVDSSFGHQEVQSIQLLSMEEEKDQNGYYKCLKECHFDQ